MKLLVSEVERAAMAAMFLRPASRGGSADILLIQDDLHTLLGMDKFEGKESVDMGKLSATAVEVEIPDGHVLVLREMLGWPGQHHNAARLVARVLRRLGKPAQAPAPTPPVTDAAEPKKRHRG